MGRGNGKDSAKERYREAAFRVRGDGKCLLQIGDITFIAKNDPQSMQRIRKMESIIKRALAIPVRITIAPNWLETSSAQNDGCLCGTPATSDEIGPSHKENPDA